MLIKDLEKALFSKGFELIEKRKTSFSLGHNYYFYVKSGIVVILEEALIYDLGKKVNDISFAGNLKNSKSLVESYPQYKFSGVYPCPIQEVYRIQSYLNSYGGTEAVIDAVGFFLSQNILPPENLTYFDANLKQFIPCPQLGNL